MPLARQGGDVVIRRILNRALQTSKPEETIDVVLWGKADCSLCDRAKAVLERLSHDYPLQVSYRDITANPADFERFRYVIPVVELPDGTHFEGKITEHWLRRALDKRA